MESARKGVSFVIALNSSSVKLSPQLHISCELTKTVVFAPVIGKKAYFCTSVGDTNLLLVKVGLPP